MMTTTHICDECETVSHCMKNGCVPKQPAQQCKWPICQSEEYQQALAQEIERELVGEQPAQRTWVSLTDEQIEAMDCINALWDDGESCTIIGIKEFARKIEAKLMEKNT